MRRRGMSKRAFLACLAEMTAMQAGNAFAAPTLTVGQAQAGQTQGAWVRDGANWKYQGSDGAFKTGWIRTATGWYYLDPATGIMRTGRATIDGKTFCFENGADGGRSDAHRLDER